MEKVAVDRGEEGIRNADSVPERVNEDCAGDQAGGQCLVFSGWASTEAGTCRGSEERKLRNFGRELKSQ